MKLGNLAKLDSSFKLISPIDSNITYEFEVLGIADSYLLKKDHLVFVKNKKFLQDFLEKNKSNKNVGIVLEKKFYESLSSLDLKTIEDCTQFISTTDDVNLSMSFMSKSFFDEYYKNPNDIVDGRQMGTATIHPTAWIAQGVFVGENVVIGENVKLHPGVVLMSGAEIEQDSEIFSNTVLYRNVKIGKRVRIHASCTIGADGFGYNFHNGVHLKVWHMGSVVIGDDVELGASTSVDSGTFSPTVVGAGSKLDNMCHLGHNVHLGKGVILCGGAAVAGSTTLEDYVVMGGQAAIGNALVIGKGAQIAAMSGVTGNIEAGAVVGGYPARNFKDWMKGIALIRKLTKGDNNVAK
jgi:UDP-3-O-[3-hydroxymyristoyl] glucosamine N-acyltransferase